MRSVLVAAALLFATALAGCVGTPPEGLTCEAKDEGNHLSWDAHENATGYAVYRQSEDDPENVTFLGETEETEFLDTNVTRGTTYAYHVTVVSEEGESLPASCEVTAVPYFAGAILGALAVVGGVAAYVVLRRR